MTHYISNKTDIICSGYPCGMESAYLHGYMEPRNNYGGHEVVKDSYHGWVCLGCHETKGLVQIGERSDAEPRSYENSAWIFSHDINGKLVHPGLELAGEDCRWWSLDGIHRLRYAGFSTQFRSYVYKCPCGRKILNGH